MRLSKFEKYAIIFFLGLILVFVFLNIKSENKSIKEINLKNQTLVIDTTIVENDKASNKKDISVNEDDEFSSSLDTTSIDSISPPSSLQNYIIGNWRSQNFRINFFDNGTFLVLIDGEKKSSYGRWKIENRQFLLKYIISQKDFEYHNFYETNKDFMIFGYDTESDSKRYKFYKIH